MKAADPEMQAVLREEVSGLFDELLALLDQFEDGEIQAVELIRRGFRIYHNAKGALRIGGQSRLELLTHLVEDQLSALRDGRTASVSFPFPSKPDISVSDLAKMQPPASPRKSTPSEVPRSGWPIWRRLANCWRVGWPSSRSERR